MGSGFHQQRKSDRPIRRFARAVILALIPAMLGAVSYLWAEKEKREELLHKNTEDIKKLEVQVNAVETRVNDSIAIGQETKKEILAELKLIKTVMFKVLLRTETLDEGGSRGKEKSGQANGQ